MKFRAIVALGITFMLSTVTAFSQAGTFPSQPIQIVVGFPPGGSADTTARIIGEGLSKELGQPVIVVNKPGAGTNIAAQFVSRAQADGYTLLLGGTSQVYSPGLLYPTMKANLARDFAPIGGVVTVPNVLVVRQDSPFRDVDQLIAAARSKPGKINYGSSGSGVGPQITMEMLAAKASIAMTHIPYKGTAPMLAALLAGDVDIAFDVASSSAPMIQAGKLRGLAASGMRRMAMFPQIPTVAETGYPGFEAATWYGLVAPQGTPNAIVETLNAALQKVLRHPRTLSSLGALGNEVMPGTPAEFQVFLASEHRKWTSAVKELKVRLD